MGVRPFPCAVERDSIQVERSARSVGRKEERTAVRRPRGRDIAARRRRRHHRLTARIRIDEHDLGRAAARTTLDRDMTPVRRPSRRGEYGRFARARAGLECRAASLELLAIDDHQRAHTAGQLDGCDAPAVRREVHIREPCPVRETPYRPRPPIEPVQVTRERDVAPDLELIEVQRIVTQADLLSAIPRGQPPCSASVERDAVERWKPVCVAPGIHDRAVAVEARSGHQVPVMGQAHRRRPGTGSCLRRLVGRDGGREVAREVAPQPAERCAVHRSEGGRAEVREAAGRAPREIGQLLFAKPPRQIGVEVPRRTRTSRCRRASRSARRSRDRAARTRRRVPPLRRRLGSRPRPDAPHRRDFPRRWQGPRCAIAGV